MTNESKGYNGWTNYATWRVQLEVFSDLDLTDWNLERLGVDDLADWLQEYVENHVEETTQTGIARDYAMAFLADVNWCELARHARDDYAAEHGDETESEDA
jgi:hypothetical protein